VSGGEFYDDGLTEDTLRAAGVIYGELPVNPSCPCGCNDFNIGPCPIPSRGIPSRWCHNAQCKCIALVSQGGCEGCYVATK